MYMTWLMHMAMIIELTSYCAQLVDNGKSYCAYSSGIEGKGQDEDRGRSVGKLVAQPDFSSACRGLQSGVVHRICWYLGW